LVGDIKIKVTSKKNSAIWMVWLSADVLWAIVYLQSVIWKDYPIVKKLQLKKKTILEHAN